MRLNSKIIALSLESKRNRNLIIKSTHSTLKRDWFSRLVRIFAFEEFNLVIDPLRLIWHDIPLSIRCQPTFFEGICELFIPNP